MVAYNFQPQFEAAIKSGKKTHTIRRNAKRRHARIGESLQLYVGQRQSGCRKILEVDPVCVDVYQVVIDIGPESIKCISIGGACVKSIDKFAKADGFKNAAAMHAFWLSFHGEGKFVGTLIEWKSAPVYPVVRMVDVHREATKHTAQSSLFPTGGDHA